MTNLELKSNLHELIDGVNDNTVLRAIQVLLKKQYEEDLVGFDSRQKPISRKAFIKRIEKAEWQVKQGKYVTIDQLEKEAEHWL